MKTTEALGALHLNSSTKILEITNYGGILAVAFLASIMTQCGVQVKCSNIDKQKQQRFFIMDHTPLMCCRGMTLYDVCLCLKACITHWGGFSG